MNLSEYIETKETTVNEAMGVDQARKRVSKLPNFNTIPNFKGLDMKASEFTKHDIGAVKAHLNEYNKKVENYNKLKSKLGKPGDPTIGGKGSAFSDEELADRVKEMKQLAKEISKKRSELTPIMKDLAAAASKAEVAASKRQAESQARKKVSQSQQETMKGMAKQDAAVQKEKQQMKGKRREESKARQEASKQKREEFKKRVSDILKQLKQKEGD